MELWMMIEGLFRLQQKEISETLETWLTATTPESNWKDKYKDEKEFKIMNNRINKI